MPGLSPPQTACFLVDTAGAVASQTHSVYHHHPGLKKKGENDHIYSNLQYQKKINVMRLCMLNKGFIYREH